MDIATLRATIAALQSVVVRTPAQMADRDARIRRCRQQIADLKARQAPTVELTADELRWIKDGPSLDYRNAAADANYYRACA
jgi:hypothetical protein